MGRCYRIVHPEVTRSFGFAAPRWDAGHDLRNYLFWIHGWIALDI